MRKTYGKKLEGEARENFKAIMAAARHLNASQMARVAYRFSSGIDWTGSPKGSIAEFMATTSVYTGNNSLDKRNPPSAENIAEKEAFFRLKTSTKGESALREQDLPVVQRELATFQKQLKTAETQPKTVRGKKNYAREYAAHFARVQIQDLEDAILAID